MTLINAAKVKPMEKLSALEVLACMGYDPTTPKVKRAAEYLELWREKSVEAADRFRLDSKVIVRASTTKGGPCEICGEPRNRHVCVSCSPTGEDPGSGCVNCRGTGWDQTPCLPKLVEAAE